MSQFGRNLKEAKKRYKAFVEDVDPDSLENPNKALINGFILGGEEFAKWIDDQFLSPQPDDRERPQLKRLKPRVDMDNIISAVSKSFGIEAEQILAKGKKRNIARDVAIYLARDLAGKSGKELGEIFGNVSGAAITMRHKVVNEQIRKNSRLKGRINKLIKQIINI